MNKDAVRIFLKTAKIEIKKGNCYFALNRKIDFGNKTVSAKQCLLDLGIMNTKQIWDYICKLEETDCIKVDTDYNLKRDYNCEIFVFIKTINHKIIYIKLTINKKNLVCISFHESIQRGV